MSAHIMGSHIVYKKSERVVEICNFYVFSYCYVSANSAMCVDEEVPDTCG